MEERRKNIRELNAQQEESLKILKALERKLGLDVANDRALGSPNTPMPSDSGIAAVATIALSDPAAHEQVQRNVHMMDMFKSLGPDTSDSEAVKSDEEGQHLTYDELAECAVHVR